MSNTLAKILDLPITPTKTKQRTNLTRGELMELFLEAKEREITARAEAEQYRALLKKRVSVGRHKDCVVYRVGKVEVSGYTRRAYVALRAINSET